jgi:hypothetical protein
VKHGVDSHHFNLRDAYPWGRRWVWKESHGLMLLHPANAVVNIQEGNAKRS